MLALHRLASTATCASSLLLIVCALMAGCSAGRDQAGSLNSGSLNPVNWITPYKADVIQGNFVSREQVAQLRAGQTRDQVKGLLGTPLMASLFHADRWDYVFTLRRQGVQSQAYKYTVYFTGDQLVRFEGDAMPSEADFIEKLDSKRRFSTVPLLEATQAQMSTADEPIVSRGAVDVAAPAPATLAYPPLESARP